MNSVLNWLSKPVCEKFGHNIKSLLIEEGSTPAFSAESISYSTLQMILEKSRTKKYKTICTRCGKTPEQIAGGNQ